MDIRDAHPGTAAKPKGTGTNQQSDGHDPGEIPHSRIRVSTRGCRFAQADTGRLNAYRRRAFEITLMPLIVISAAGTKGLSRILKRDTWPPLRQG